MNTQQARFKTKKKQINKYDDNAIYENGVSGDISGMLIQKLNAGQLSEIQGNKNTTLKNFLSINEYTQSEKNQNEHNSINMIDRIGPNYIINGNTTLEDDKSNPLSPLNISIVDFFIRKSIHVYSDNLISSNLNINELKDNIKQELNGIMTKVEKYINGFSYEVYVNNKNKSIDINLYYSGAKLPSSINISVNRI